MQLLQMCNSAIVRCWTWDATCGGQLPQSLEFEVQGSLTYSEEGTQRGLEVLYSIQNTGSGCSDNEGSRFETHV